MLATCWLIILQRFNMSEPTTEGGFLLPFQRRNNWRERKCHVYAYLRPDTGLATRNGRYVMCLHVFAIFYWEFGAAVTLVVTYDIDINALC